MTTGCPRSWEVEAARDGRLTGDARESYEAHRLACASCAADAAALDDLARGLRGLTPPEVDDVALRRLRNRVLEAVDAERVGGRGRRGWGRASGVVAACALAMVVVGGVTLAVRRGANDQAKPVAAAAPAAAASAETTVDVTPTEGARFTRSADDGVERFDLREGTLRLRVRRAPLGRRVVVTLPDGELEDIGTVFEVVVAEGRTERVGVEEGRVILRLTSAPSVTIGAGGGWRRIGVASSVSGATSAASAGSKPHASASTREPSKDTLDAEAGAEDKAYLKVLRLLGEGREPEARSAARAYLREFPAGFRREEMRGVAAGE